MYIYICVISNADVNKLGVHKHVDKVKEENTITST